MKFLIAIFMLGSLASCGTDIDAGSEGFMFYKYGDGVDTSQVYGEGFEWHSPWNDLIVYDMREKSKEYQSKVLDKNGLDVTIIASVNYRLVKGTSAKVHLKYGEGYEDILIDKVSRGAIKDVVGKYGAEELYSTKREALESEIELSIEQAFEGNFVSLSFVEVSDVDLPPAISKAIENKEKQEQANLLAAKKEQEQINLAKAKRAAADGEAYKIEKEATANAKAIRLKQEALRQSPQYVELIKAQNWDGKMPQVMSGGNGTSLWMDLRNRNN